VPSRLKATMSLTTRNSIALWTIGGVLFLAQPAAHSATLVRGENRTCRDFADIDYALDHPGSQYFKGWTSEDFDAAETWVASCVGSPATAQDKQRRALLAESRRSFEVRGEVKANDDALKALHARELREQEERERARVAAEQVRAEAERAQEVARGAEERQELTQMKTREAVAAQQSANRATMQAAHEECLRSTGYHRYVAGTKVIEALARQSEGQQALEHEKRVEEVSETTNLYAKHRAGEALVSAQDAVTKWFAEYRQYGGDANGPSSVSLTANPCN
jgi:hypothetical protein